MSRIIHLDVYSNRAEFIYKRIWHYFNYRWSSTQMSRNMCYSKIEVQPNGEVTIAIDDSSYMYHYTTFRNKNDIEIKKWLASSIYQIVRRELACYDLSSENWSRTSDWTIDRLKDDEQPNVPAVTAPELYFIYDKLLGSKRMNAHWKDKSFIDNLVGTERDAVATELEIAKREELNKIEQKFNADKKKLENKCYDEVCAAQKLVRDKYKALESDLKAAYLKAKKELEESLNFLNDDSIAASGLL